MILWRISNHVDLSGAGGLYASARWHTQGKPVVYLADSPASAMLETLAHLELDESERPDRYCLLKIDVDEGISSEAIELDSLSPRWQKDEQETRPRGDRWIKKGETALLRVPSAITPETWNWLLNPKHKNAARVRVMASARYPYDPRLF